jgi:hypothetical protein
MCSARRVDPHWFVTIYAHTVCVIYSDGWELDRPACHHWCPVLSTTSEKVSVRSSWCWARRNGIDWSTTQNNWVYVINSVSDLGAADRMQNKKEEEMIIIALISCTDFCVTWTGCCSFFRIFCLYHDVIMTLAIRCQKVLLYCSYSIEH